MKLRLMTLLLCLLPLSAYGKSANSPIPLSDSSAKIIESYLKDVSENSRELRILALDEQSELKGAEISLTQFDTTGYLNLSGTDSKDVPTSPFSSESTRRFESSLGVSKLWQSGLTTTLDYTLVDNLTQFPARDASDFFSPTLSLTLTGDLFQDITSGRLKLAEPKLKAEEKATRLATKIKKKTVLVQSLLALADLFELKNGILLQQELCDSESKQTKQLKTKRARGSIPRRDYLLAQKNWNACRATIKTFHRDLLEKRENLLTKYGVRFSKYEKIDIDTLFAVISSLFHREDLSSEKVNFDNIDELISLKTDIDVLKLEEKELRALGRTSVDLSLSAGLSGLNSQFATSHEDLSKFNFPFVTASVKIDFPFQDRTSKVNITVNKYRQESLAQQLLQVEAEKRSRFRTLLNGLKQDVLIYKDYKTNVQLSADILNEARRDFNNGRIDFFTLSEFQKSLTQSRRELSSLRSQIVVKTVEYIDYFHFFDSYF